MIEWGKNEILLFDNTQTPRDVGKSAAAIRPPISSGGRRNTRRKQTRRKQTRRKQTRHKQTRRKHSLHKRKH